MNRKQNTNKKMITTGYQCFHCGTYGVVWEADFDFDDYGYDGKGLIHACHCASGADIEYAIRIDESEEEDEL